MAGPLLSSSGGGLRKYRRPPVYDINVTPFVDVMLVLLIVFMISAPLLTQGVDVSLPEVENTPITTEAKDPIQITIKRSGSVYIQSQEIEKNKLRERLEAIKKARQDTSIVLRADQSVDYGRVMEVMGQLQAAGLVDVGLVTQPPGREN